jgi:pyruvyltransferase
LPIELFHWEHRPSFVNLPLLDRVKRRPIPNFGDEIGPMVVRAILENRGLPTAEGSRRDGRLISVGSVLHFAQPGDHVWGTGINAKRRSEYVKPGEVMIHAVRGPRTAETLESLGFDVPHVYGDPGLLIREIPAIAGLVGVEKKRRVALVPNFNDLPQFRRHPDLVSPLQSPVAVATAIAESEIVVGSSLHAMVFADALGVSSRLIASSNEHPFKYEDYYLGSGREPQKAAETVDEALRLGPGEPAAFEAAPLLAAFPDELFSA